MDFPKTLNPVGHSAFLTTMDAYRRRTGLAPLRTSGAWVTANRGILTPVYVDRPFLVKRLYAFNGAVVSGNCDMAIFDTSEVPGIDTVAFPGVNITGSSSLLTSPGSTPQAGVNQWQSFATADVLLAPGLYWLGYILDNTTGTVMRISAPPVPQLGNTEATLGGFPMTSVVATSRGTNTNPIPLLAIGGIT